MSYARSPRLVCSSTVGTRYICGSLVCTCTFPGEALTPQRRAGCCGTLTRTGCIENPRPSHCGYGLSIDRATLPSSNENAELQLFSSFVLQRFPILFRCLLP